MTICPRKDTTFLELICVRRTRLLATGSFITSRDARLVMFQAEADANHTLRRPRSTELSQIRSGQTTSTPSYPVIWNSPVSFKEGEHYFENALERADGKTNKGAFGRAVRSISDTEYDLITQAGFVRTIGEISNVTTQVSETLYGFSEEEKPYDRPIVERMISRPFREAAFALGVKEAYANTCAMSGISIINGGGRAEVQAAHIRPVADRGPIQSEMD